MVYSSLRFCQSAKGRERSIADWRGETRSCYEIFDHFPCPGRNIWGDHLYRYPVCVLSGSGHWRRGQPHRVSDDGVHGLLHGWQIRTCIDQCAQQHIASEPGGGIDPGVASAAHVAAICAAR